eukprot:2049713-Amphidinium_carterae.2
MRHCVQGGELYDRIQQKQSAARCQLAVNSLAKGQSSSVVAVRGSIQSRRQRCCLRCSLCVPLFCRERGGPVARCAAGSC